MGKRSLHYPGGPKLVTRALKSREPTWLWSGGIMAAGEQASRRGSAVFPALRKEAGGPQARGVLGPLGATKRKERDFPPGASRKEHGPADS